MRNLIVKSLCGKLAAIIIALHLFSTIVHALECENGKYFNKKTGKYEICRPFPELSGCKYLGSRGFINNIRSIPGEKTEMRSYQCGHDLITIYVLPDQTVYCYAIHDEHSNEIQWYWDYDRDGNFGSGIKITY